jgi:hypothetical protein
LLLAAFGAGAIAVGSAAGLAAASVLFFVLIRRGDSHGIGPASAVAVGPCVAAGVAALALAAVNALVVDPAAGRPELGLLAAGEAVAFAGLYLAALGQSGCIRRDEVRAVLQLRPGLRARFSA